MDEHVVDRICEILEQHGTHLIKLGTLMPLLYAENPSIKDYIRNEPGNTSTILQALNVENRLRFIQVPEDPRCIYMCLGKNQWTKEYSDWDFDANIRVHGSDSEDESAVDTSNNESCYALPDEEDEERVISTIMAILEQDNSPQVPTAVLKRVYKIFPEAKNIIHSAEGDSFYVKVQSLDPKRRIKWKKFEKKIHWMAKLNNHNAPSEKLSPIPAPSNSSSQKASISQKASKSNKSGREPRVNFCQTKQNSSKSLPDSPEDVHVLDIVDQPTVNAMDHFERINSVEGTCNPVIESESDVPRTSISMDAAVDNNLNEANTIHFESFFDNCHQTQDSVSVVSKSTLVHRSQATYLQEYGRFGDLIPDEDETSEHSSTLNQVVLNVNDPFCAVTLGVQGSGKSHTIATIIENCTMPTLPLVKLNAPMPVLVFHYDKTVTTPCECASLVLPSAALKKHMSQTASPIPSMDLGVKKMIVLVSPTYFRQRKVMYQNLPNTTVKPLLLSWDSLTAGQLKTLMGIQPGDTQLYMGVMLNQLRMFQKDKKLPAFQQFKENIVKEFSSASQSGPLQQRLQLLETIIAESDYYSEVDKDEGYDKVVRMNELVEPGTVIITDLTDPMLDANSANGIFQVLLEQFRDTSVDGKLCVFDEAHKYLSGSKSGALVDCIVDTVRQMRHYGTKRMTAKAIVL